MVDKKKDETLAGNRFAAVRHLMGLSQRGFSEYFGFVQQHIIKLEQLKTRANEEDYYAVCKEFPEFSEWLTYGGNIELARLSVGKTQLHKYAMDLIEEDDLPILLRKKIR